MSVDVERVGETLDGQPISSLLPRVRQLARRADLDEELLERLDRVPPNGIVVVGETKKGKSSLINALLGRPGLSPVSTDLATATYIGFRHGPDRAVVTTASNVQREIALDELAAWVTVDGIEANQDATNHTVDVTVESDVLDGAELIDTPGVGGLVGKHVEMTRQAVEIAGVMLFVTDLAVPLTKPEAQFLQEIADSTDIVDVIFVANMADRLSTSEADAALDRLRDRIGEHLPAYGAAPVIKVSAHRALMASDPGLEPRRRQLLRRASGLDELASLIRDRVVRRRQVLDDAYRLRVLMRALVQIERSFRVRVEALERDDPALRLDELEDRQHSLEHEVGLAERGFQHRLNELRRSLTARVDDDTARLEKELDPSVTGGAAGSDLEAGLEERIQALFDEVTQLTRSGIGSVVRETFAAFLVEGEEETSDEFELALLTATAEAGADIDPRPVPEYREWPIAADSYATAALSISSGVSLGKLTQTVLVGSTGLGPVPIVLGLATVALSLFRVRRDRTLTASREWLNSAVKTARRDLTSATEQRLEQTALIAQMALKNLHKERADLIRREMRALRSPDRGAQLDEARADLARAESMRFDVAATLLEIDVIAPTLASEW